jgi:hypothetical protein
MRGEVLPFVAAPVAVGVLFGARTGARVMNTMKNDSIRYIFIAVLLVSSVQMLMKGLH